MLTICYAATNVKQGKPVIFFILLFSVIMAKECNSYIFYDFHLVTDNYIPVPAKYKGVGAIAQTKHIDATHY